MEHERAQNYVVRLLAQRDYSTEAIRKKLKERSASPSTIESLIAKLTAKGYLDDDRYARALINACRQKGLSDRATRAKLRAKGLSPAYLEAAPPGDPLEIASRAWEKISKRYNVSDLKDKQRAAAALARRGFSWEVIQNLLN